MQDRISDAPSQLRPRSNDGTPSDRSASEADQRPAVDDPTVLPASGDRPITRDLRTPAPRQGSGFIESDSNNQSHERTTISRHRPVENEEPEKGLPRPGDQIGPFRIEAAIGVGGMGAVFRATDIQLDRFVALKILPPSQGNRQENIDRFCQEAQAAARLDHENIARVFTIGRYFELQYIAFEYIEGQTLRQQVEAEGPLHVAAVVNYTLQIAGALVHASDRGVVHRDIKPSNIIVTPQGRAKLVDMGLARRFEREGVDDRLTHSNMTLGTFDYISPEQARDPRSVDCRSDLYSLGCTLFHMLTGRPPFPGGTVLQKLLSHREEPVPSVRSIRPDVPQILGAIVSKLMAKEPERRYQTPQHLLRDLLALAGGIGLQSLSPEGLVWTEPTSSAPSWERHLFWGIPALALVLVVGTIFLIDRGPVEDFEDGVFEQSLNSESASGLQPIELQTEGPVDLESSRTSVRSETSRNAGVTQIGTPRRIEVVSGEDLQSALRTAPSDSTLILVSQGRYELEPVSGESEPIRPNLTIKAAPGIDRPVIAPRPSSASPQSRTSQALLYVKQGSLVIEGVDFVSDGLDAPLIRVDSGQLECRRCSFRLAESESGIQLGGSRPEIEERAIPIRNRRTDLVSAVIEECAIIGGDDAIQTMIPVDLTIVDGFVAVGGSVIAMMDRNDQRRIRSSGTFDNPSASEIQGDKTRLHLERLSIRAAGLEPVFRFRGTEVVVRSYDLLVSPPDQLGLEDQDQITLVQTEDSTSLRWTGVDNLYNRISTYLDVVDFATGLSIDELRSFQDWVDATDRGELGRSQASDRDLWDAVDPALALVAGLPPESAFLLRQDAFDLGSRERVLGVVVPGARRGPSGATDRLNSSQVQLTDSSVPVDLTPEFSGDLESEIEADDDVNGPYNDGPMPIATSDLGKPNRPTESVRQRSEISTENVVVELDQPPSTPSRTITSREPVEGELPPVFQGPPTIDDRSLEMLPSGSGEKLTETGPVRNTIELLERIKRLGSRGGTIELADDASFVLSAISLEGITQLELVASGIGPGRPLIRFQPQADFDRSFKTTPRSFFFYLTTDSGLTLRGVDIVIDPELATPKKGELAAFLVEPGAALRLDRCTITQPGDQSSTVVALPEVSPLDDPEDTGPEDRARIDFTSSLIRAGGDVFSLGGPSSARLTLDNTIVVSEGALVHVNGHAPLEPESSNLHEIELRLQWVTAINRGGLGYFKGDLGRREFVDTKVELIKSIVGTGTKDGVLFRVEGSPDDQLDQSTIEILESRDVAYHQVEIFRRESSSMPGSLRNDTDLEGWTESLGDSEAGARYGDVGFSGGSLELKNLWEVLPEELKPNPIGIADDIGPNLRQIPEPPTNSSVQSGEAESSNRSESNEEALKMLGSVLQRLMNPIRFP